MAIPISIAGGGPALALDSAISALAPAHWFRADTYTVDGGSSKVATFTNRAGTGTLGQATAANQCPVPVAEATLAGRPAATFAAASTTRYVSSLAAASWTFLHDGSGAELFIVCTPTSGTFGKVLGTQDGSASTERGLSVFRNTTQWIGWVGNGTIQIINSGSVGSSPNNVGTYLNVLFGMDISSDYYLQTKTTSIFNGDVTGAVSGGLPLTTFSIGDRPSGGAGVDMKWADLIIFNRVLTLSERIVAQYYLTSRYGT